MKRILLINLICIISLFCLFQQAFCLDWPPDIDVYYIKFNYQSGHSSDALKIKNISAPEWANGGYTNEEIAYIKNQSSRKIKAKFWIDRSGIDWICVYADKISGTGIGDVQDDQIDFNGSQYSQEEQLTCGSVPGSVGKRNFTWRWYAFAIDDYELEEEIHIGDTGPHTHYTVLASPKSPMSEPWKDVLDYACDWASGKSSTSSTITALTDSLYNSGVKYDGRQHYTRNNYYDFYLTELLAALVNPSNVQMDCRDFANFLHVLTNSLGISGKYNVLDDVYDSDNGFYYNYILPARGSWHKGYWNYHQVGWYYNSKVADAAAKIDNDSDPTQGPGAENHDPKLASGDMILSAYLDKLTLNNNIGSITTGICAVH